MEFTAKTEDEAIAKGLAHLGLDRDDVSVEILDRGKTGFLGIGHLLCLCKGGFPVHPHSLLLLQRAGAG